MKTNFILQKITFFIFLFFIISCSKEDDIDTKPFAAFSAKSTEIVKGGSVLFTDASFDQGGSIASWAWDFGNGDTSSERSPSYVYKDTGTFIVKLKVKDNSGNLNANDFSKTIKVLEPSTATQNPAVAWQYTLPAAVEESSPAVDDNGVVYIGCSPASTAPTTTPNFFAISNGSLKWSKIIGTSTTVVRSSPSIDASGNIYVGTYDKNLYGFSPDGTQVMKVSIGNNPKYSGPIFGLNDEIYIGTQTQTILAFNKGGQKLWETYSTKGEVNATAAVGSDGTVYLGSTGDTFYAINPANGTVKWKLKFGSWTATATAIGTDGTIYFAGEGNGFNSTYGGVLLALNTDGTIKWRADLAGKANYGGPAVAPDGTIYVGTNAGTLNSATVSASLMAYSPSGTLLWSYPTKGNVTSVPAIDNDGNIYFADDLGWFYVVDPKGNKKWKETQLGTKIWNSPTIGKDGTIYIAATQANATAILYALKTNATGLANGGWPMRSRNAKHTGHY